MVVAISILLMLYWLLALLLVSRICGPAFPRETRRVVLGGAWLAFGLYVALCAAGYVEHSGLLGPRRSLEHNYSLSPALLYRHAFCWLLVYLVIGKGLLWRFPILLVAKTRTQAVDALARQARAFKPQDRYLKFSLWSIAFWVSVPTVMILAPFLFIVWFLWVMQDLDRYVSIYRKRAAIAVLTLVSTVLVAGHMIDEYSTDWTRGEMLLTILMWLALPYLVALFGILWKRAAVVRISFVLSSLYMLCFLHYAWAGLGWDENTQPDNRLYVIFVPLMLPYESLLVLALFYPVKWVGDRVAARAQSQIRSDPVSPDVAEMSPCQ